MGRRLLGVPHPGVQLGSGWQQQLGLSSLSPDNTTKLSLRGLLAVLSQHAQHAQHAEHAQQLLSRTKHTLDAAVVKLEDCAISTAQHTQRAPQHAQQLLSWATQTLNAAVSKLADCAVAAPQYAQQLLSRTRQALDAAVSKIADCAVAAAPQHAQQLLSKTRQAVDAAVSKLADCAVAAPQRAQQLLSRTRQAVSAAVSKLADCVAAAPQHAQQLLSMTRQAVNAAISKHAGHAAAVHALLHHQAAQLLDDLGRAVHRRAMAANTPESVEVEVTVNVPSGQSQSATQARIEGPSFAPALQQSLSNAGMMVHRHAFFGGTRVGGAQAVWEGWGWGGGGERCTTGELSVFVRLLGIPDMQEQQYSFSYSGARWNTR